MPYLRKEGLDAMEIEFVRGVRMGADTARRAAASARENGISLSCHAPYWINCAAKEPAKIRNSVRNLMETARAAQALGASVIVFHPAFYLGRPASEAMAITKRTLSEVEARMRREGISGVTLGAETAGKATQLGSLDEVIELAQSLSVVKPVVDFAHLHARGNGWIKGKAQYAEVFGKLEAGLGSGAVKAFHSHFSEIEFGEGGEKNHAALGSLPRHSPDFRPLAELVAENGYSGTFICETPMLDIDARKMARMLAEAGARPRRAESLQE
jgi:deoxyribonuclease-4